MLESAGSSTRPRGFTRQRVRKWDFPLPPRSLRGFFRGDGRRRKREGGRREGLHLEEEGKVIDGYGHSSGSGGDDRQLNSCRPLELRSWEGTGRGDHLRRNGQVLILYLVLSIDW